MKITFRQTLDIRQGSCYMKLLEKQERPDIKAFLEGVRTGNEKQDRGIKRYLCTLGIYDRNEDLSDVGKELLTTGLYPSRSEGEYAVWYAEVPILNATHIIYYERENTRFDVKQRLKPNLWIDAIECAETDEKPRLMASLKDGQHLAVIPVNNSSQGLVEMVLELDLDAEERRSSHYYLGQINSSEKKYTLRRPKQDSEDDYDWEGQLLPKIAYRIKGEWMQKHNRVSLTVEQAKSLGGTLALEHFSLGSHSLKLSEGQKVELKHIGLMPSTRSEAIKWFELLLILESQKAYLQQTDLETLAEIRNEEALSIYREFLDTPKAEDLAQKYRKDRVSYWHLMAPHDLRPDNKLQIAAPINLRAGTDYGMANLVQRLGIRSGARWVTYYDKYGRLSHQQTYVNLFLSAIDADHSAVITDKSEMQLTREGKTYLEQYSKSKKLSLIDKNDVLGGLNMHDRYLILCDKQGALFLWSLTNGLSIFNKGDNAWDKVGISTQLISQQALTITPISIDTQSQLIDYLNKYFHVR